MPIGAKNIVRVGKETTRGTAASSLALDLHLQGAGLEPTFTDHLGEVRGAATFPDITDLVGLGLTPGFRITPIVNVDTVKDLILMAMRDEDGELPSFTFAETSGGVGNQRFVGCICRELSAEFSRSANPNESALLSVSLDFAAMGVEDASGVSAGTKALGRSLQIRKSTFTVNSADQLDVLSYRLRVANELFLGPHDTDGKLRYIEDGPRTVEMTLASRFTTEAWRNLVKNATEFAAAIELATGTATETVTLDAAKCKADVHDHPERQGVITEQLSIKPYHTGSAEALVPSFGSGIGSSVLGL